MTISMTNAPAAPTVRYGRHSQRDCYSARVARWLLAHHHDPLRAEVIPTGHGDETVYMIGKTVITARTLDITTPPRVSWRQGRPHADEALLRMFDGA